MPLMLKSFFRDAINPLIPQVAALRISIFRDFPYLYDGNEAYERSYLGRYVSAQDGLLLLVFDGDKIVGASTGLPLSQEMSNFKAPFAKQGYDIDQMYYCAESILLKAYRGQGVGIQFFETREAHARSLGLNYSCFCAVDRPLDHPLRPRDYQALDAFWQKRGYQKQEKLVCELPWKDIDQAQESIKTMTFWLKALC
ncbi:MAG: GNAT family N-acetyltransferase [Deinococcales bacterium]